MKSLAALLSAAVFGAMATCTSAVAQKAFTPESANGTVPASELAAKTGMIRIVVRLKQPPSLKIGDSATSRAAFKQSILALQDEVIADVFGSVLGRMMGASRGLKKLSIVPVFTLNATAAEIGALRNDPRVESVREETLQKPTLLNSLPIIKMTGKGNAFAKGATGNGRVVAVVDTGVNGAHEFLAGKVVAEGCFNTTDAVNGSTSRCPGAVESSTALGSGVDCAVSSAEGCGHGTHVAGIAAGRNTSLSTGEPKSGVGRGASIIAINVFSVFNNPSICGASSNPCVLSYSFDQMEALQYVYDLQIAPTGSNIDAVNMSLGGNATITTCDSDPLKPLIDLLLSVQTATVIAAGNSFYINAVSFPGCISTAITVSASSKRKPLKPERVSVYSNISTVTDLLAPGGDIKYPFKSKKDQIRSSYGGGYGNLAGTSMAAPHVAGAIAAIRSRPACTSKTIAEIVNALKTSGKRIRDWRKVQGFPRITKPRINVIAAMKAMGCA